MPPYILRPFAGLLQHWQPKMTLALLASLFWEGAARVLGLYDQLLSTDPLLLLMAVTILILDWVTGIAAAMRDGDPVESHKLRQAGWKLVEYTAVVSVCVLLANGAEGKVVQPLFDLLDEAALFYIGTTEGLSVVENVKGSRQAALKWLGRIRDLMRGDSPWEKGGQS